LALEHGAWKALANIGHEDHYDLEIDIIFLRKSRFWTNGFDELMELPRQTWASKLLPLALPDILFLLYFASFLLARIDTNFRRPNLAHLPLT